MSIARFIIFLCLAAPLKAMQKVKNDQNFPYASLCSQSSASRLSYLEFLPQDVAMKILNLLTADRRLNSVLPPRAEVLLNRGSDNGVYAASLSPNGQIALSGSQNGMAHLFDLVNQSVLPLNIATGGTIMPAAITPNGRYALLADCELIKVLDLREVKNIRTLSLAHHVQSFAVTPDSKWVIAGGWDQNAKVWDLTTSQVGDITPSAVLGGHGCFVSAVAISADGRCALTKADKNKVFLWDLIEPVLPVATLEIPNDEIGEIAMTEDGRYGLTGSARGIPTLWDLSDYGKTFYHLVSTSSCVKKVAITRDGKRAITASNTTIMVYDLQNKEGSLIHPLATFQAHRLWIRSLSITGDWGLTASEDGTAFVCNLIDPTIAFRLDSNVDHLHCAAMTPDCRLALTGGVRGIVHLWDLSPATNPKNKLSLLQLTLIISLCNSSQLLRDEEKLFYKAELEKITNEQIRHEVLGYFTQRLAPNRSDEIGGAPNQVE